jgi:uncharacterized protein (TIGR03437 family)
MKAPQVMRLIYALVAGVLPLTLHGFYKESGPDPRYTAAPGDSKFACATAGCHTSVTGGSGGGPINFHGGGVSASFSQGSTYTPGTPVTITVKVTDPVNRKYGFQMTARLESNLAQAQAGTFQVISPSDKIGVICDNESPRVPGRSCPASAPVEFIEHNDPATTPWTFSWMPPATASGPVHFYVAGNAVNGNSTEDADDHVYTNEYVLTPSGDCVGSNPVVSAVISAGAFGARTDFAPGTWLEIYGTNFSTVTKEWAGADFNDLTAPQFLDRVRVKVNGKDAFTRFISSGQVNVQAPQNTNGPLTVTVTNCERTSLPANLTQLSAAPGMLAPPSFIVGGKQLLAALTTDGTNFIGNIPGVPSRPARPGETIITYGIGFGVTTPPIAPGTIANIATRLADPLVVTVGGVQIPESGVLYAGLAPGFVGLYQFNIVVPNVPDGEQPVTVRVGSATVPQTLFLSVKR